MRGILVEHSRSGELRPVRRDGCRVLIVDDDALARGRMAALLGRAQYRVEQAASAEEALRVLHAVDCHIVLTDWQMPGMDGLTLCRTVRFTQTEGYTYLLMLTIRNSKDDLLASLAAGVDDFLAKGTSSLEILARLDVGRRIVSVERALRNVCANHGGLTDPVTGAMNSRHFVREVTRELARARRYRRPLAILRAEVAQFAPTVERYGYQAGVDMLTGFVERIGGCIRKSSDWIARLDGADFAIVLPETASAGAGRVMQKFEAILSSEPLLTSSGQPIELRADMTMFAVDAQHRAQSARRLEELIRTADRGSSGGRRGPGSREAEKLSFGETYRVRRLN